MNTVLQEPVETTEITQEFEKEKTSAGALVLQESQQITKVEDEPTYIIVCNKALEAAANIKSIEAYMQPHIDRAHAAHKRLTTIRARLVEPFEQGKKKFSALAFDFQIEQENIRRRQEEAARAEALKQQQADQAAEAEQLAAEGRVEEGVAVLENPVVPVIPATVATSVPKVKGIGTASQKYVGEITDLKAFIEGIATGKTPITLLKKDCVDQMALDKLCGIYREATAFPGVTLKKKTGGSVRG
jgi:hypothetical protein